MSVATDIDVSIEQKTEFDADFESTDDNWTIESVPTCTLTCPLTNPPETLNPTG